MGAMEFPRGWEFAYAQDEIVRLRADNERLREKIAVARATLATNPQLAYDILAAPEGATDGD